MRRKEWWRAEVRGGNGGVISSPISMSSVALISISISALFVFSSKGFCFGGRDRGEKKNSIKLLNFAVSLKFANSTLPLRYFKGDFTLLRIFFSNNVFI